MCPSGQRASFDSRTWEPIWAGANEPDYAGRTNNIWCVNAKLLNDRGIDPYAVWAKRGRRLSLGVRVCRDPGLAISKMGMDVKIECRAPTGWIVRQIRGTK